MGSIDEVFRPTDAADNEWRKEPQSESKFRKQDAAFQGTKRCLGWDYAVRSKNLLVAPHRQASKALDSIRSTRDLRRVNLKSWRSLVGQLRSLVPGLPGSEGQFSLMQDAPTHHSKGRRVYLVLIDERSLKKGIHTMMCYYLIISAKL
jgi:hypothetical protein